MRSLLLSCAQIAIPCGGICCHSNETRAPIANPPNSAQLGESTTNFRSMSVVATWLDGLRCHLVRRLTSAQATLLDGNPARLQARGGSTPTFGTPGPYHAPSYIRVRAVVWVCGEGQTDTHSHRQGRRSWWCRWCSCTTNINIGGADISFCTTNNSCT